MLLAALGCGLSASRAMAQQGGDPLGFEDLRARMAQQDQEIRRLQEQVAGLQQGAQQGTPASLAAYSADGAAPAGAGPAGQYPPGSAVVGSDMHATASFQDGLFLWVTSPNKDFSCHIGYWMQLDNVWWDEDPSLKSAPVQRKGPVVSNNGLHQVAAAGVAGNGIGELEDGCYFRRIRPYLEGTFWETGEYRLILALENDTVATTGLDEFWVGETKVPVVGSVRIGHVKDPMGLEGDMTSSSRCMTFMERSCYSEAIELNQNFLTGLWLGNTLADERVSWQFCAARADLTSSSGVFFGDGQGAIQGRITALPIYEDEGRQLLHLGLSLGWRNGAWNGTLPYHLFQLRARQEMRDDVPGGGATGADNNRLIDTEAIAAHEEYILGLEALYIRGPLSVQAEYGYNWIDGAFGILHSGNAKLTPFAAGVQQDYQFNGGYVQVAYTLTGENRAYDRRLGTLARYYYGIHGPYENSWFTRDADGNLIWTRGAWEVAARYSYVDLNSGDDPATRVNGGIMNAFTLGVNWYLNNNLNVMFDWIYDQRYAVPSTGTAAAPATDPGHVNGFGIEVQFQM
jgi:phosphate-selective porin OprO/OprP